MNSGNKLLLVDGSAILHRAYHAMPDLTDRQGRPSGAIYGFVRMLLRAIKDLQPTHVAVAFDRPEPTFRKQIYIAYQAQRPELDPELAGQFQRVRELLQAMEVPVYEKAGFEADDVLGTISKIVTQENPKSQITNPKQIQILKPQTQNKNTGSGPSLFTKTCLERVEGEGGQGGVSQISNNETVEKSNNNIIILTPDKDMMQLVNKNVGLYLPIKGVSEAQLIGPAEVKDKLGVTPAQVIDYKALVGDPSDNYPGVLGIGPKTAVTLLKEFGTFEGIYKALENKQFTDSNPNSQMTNNKPASPAGRQIQSIKSKVQNDKSGPPSLGKKGTGGVMSDSVKKKLISSKEAGKISKQLAQIKTDVPLDFNLSDCQAVIQHPGHLARVLEDYGFKTLAKQMELEKSVGGEQMKLV